MEQYVYGNIGHKGYAYLSSDTEFFTPGRISAMQPVIYYNNSSPHGELSALEHQSYWMVASDLGIRGEERLFLQASGVDDYRGGRYVHGYYWEDKGEQYLYGPKLLELLKTDFMHFTQIDALCQNGALPKVDRLPTLDIQPVELDERTLKAILYEILRGHKVILQLPCEGKKAMDQSRALLLTIYEHLPYAQRRSTGFFTGATAVEALSADMPAGIRLFLLDGDADVTDLGSTGQQVFWNLDRVPEVKIPQPFDRFLCFLAQNNAEKLDPFFAYCKKLVEAGGGGISLKLPQYAFFLDCYQGSGKPVTDGEIRNWAANLYGGPLDDKIKKGLFQQLTSILSVERLQEYLCTYATSLADLQTFGVPDPEEKRKATDALGRQDDIKDIHAALTLEMTESMLTYYPDPEQAKEKIEKGLVDRFLAAIKAEYPCLTEGKPTAEVVERLGELVIMQPAEPGRKIGSYVKYAVPKELEKLREAVKNTYACQRQMQKGKGMSLISQWPFFCGTPDLRLLYGKLEEECYLSRELLAENEAESWNRKMAGRLVEVFPQLVLKSREDYQGAADWLRLDLDVYKEKGGELTPGEEQAIRGIQNNLQQVLTLWETSCTSMKNMLTLLAKINGMHMAPELAEERKNAFAADLIQAGIAIGDLTEEAKNLCSIAQEQPTEKIRLQAMVASCEGLNVIPEESTYQQAVEQSVLVLRLSEETLCDSLVEFQPDGTRQEAGDLLNRLNALKKYVPGQPLNISRPGMARWLVRNLPQNRALMLELAWRDPALGEAVLRPIAASSEPVSADVIRRLYYAGWSRRTLLSVPGGQASEAWNQALALAFPFYFWCSRSLPDSCHGSTDSVMPEGASPGGKNNRKKKGKKR